MLQGQRNEVSDTAATTAVTTLLSSPKFETSEQQQQQNIKANVAIESNDSTESKMQSASISRSLIPLTENMLALTPPLLPKKESENIIKLDEPYSMDNRTASGGVLCSSADVQLKPRLIASPIPTNKNTAMTCDMGSYDERGLYSDYIRSPPLTTFRKTHDKMIEMSSLTVNAPTTHGDFVHFEASSGTVSEEGNMLNPTDTLAETVTFLKQQQRQIATMTSTSYATPQPALMSIVPTHTQLSCLHASLAALSDDRNINCSTTDAQKTNAKLFTDFLQQHLNLQQQKTLPKRSLKLSTAELHHLLGYQKNATPTLMQRLSDAQIKCKDKTPTQIKSEDDSTSASKLLTEITIELNATDASASAESEDDNSAIGAHVTEPTLPQSEGIVMQFAARPIFVEVDATADEPQLLARYWLQVDCIDWDDGKYERVACDLTELAAEYLASETNLTTDCKRVLHLSASPNRIVSAHPPHPASVRVVSKWSRAQADRRRKFT